MNAYTLRFETHDIGQYMVYSCERYSVRFNEGISEDGKKTATVVRMFRSLDDANPYYEQVGPEELYGRVYVTNQSGRTIDTILG